MITLGPITLRTASLACIVGLAGGCATQRSLQQRAPAVSSVVQGASGRDEFEAELKGSVSSRNRANVDAARDLSGNLRIHIGDDSVVQYWLIIENPNADLFTEAQLCRLSRRGGQPAVAIFFSDAAARDKRLQFRGTLSVVKTESIERLIKDVRANPDSFYVSVRGAAGREVMRGQLR